MEELLEWGEQNGVKRKVEIKEYDEEKGYSLIAGEKLKDGEVVLSIPFANCLNAYTASKTPSFSPIYQKLTEIFAEDEEEREEDVKEVILIYFLLHEREKAEESRWAKYLKYLPTRLSSPLFPAASLYSSLFSSTEIIVEDEMEKEEQMEGEIEVIDKIEEEEAEVEEVIMEKTEEEKELEILEGSGVMDMLPALLQAQHSIHSSLSLSIPSLSHYSFTDYLWAFSIINSRGLKIFPFEKSTKNQQKEKEVGEEEEREEESEVTTTLIPIIDMANHKAEEPTLTHSSYLTPTGEVEFKSKGEREKGEEMELKYNDLANWQLLIYYGFALPHNPHDSVMVSMELDEDDYEVEIKKMLFYCTGADLGLSLEHSLSFHSNPTLFPSSLPLADSEGKGVITKGLMASVRMAMMKKEEIEVFNFEGVKELLEGPLSASNERSALSLLRDILSSLLSRYPTSLSDDRSALQSPSISITKRFYLIYIISQKSILSHALLELDHLISLLP